MAAKKKKPAAKDERNKVGEAKYWDAHYETGKPPWDHGAPSPPVVALARSGVLPKGRLCVLGCGWGNDAIWFAKEGWQVTAVDFAVGAERGLRAEATKAGVAVQFIRMDLFELPKICHASFDLVLEHTCFCAISPKRRKEYVGVVRRILKPGGTLFGVFFNHGGKGGPPFTVSAQQVRSFFGPYFDLERLGVAKGSFENRADKELLALFRLRSPLP